MMVGYMATLRNVFATNLLVLQCAATRPNFDAESSSEQ